MKNSKEASQDLLIKQLIKLDEIFYVLTDKALDQARNMRPKNCETYLRLALRAQVQSARTFEALTPQRRINLITNKLSGVDDELCTIPRAPEIPIRTD